MHDILIADNSGRKINIPVGMVSTKTSEILMNYLQKPKRSNDDDDWNSEDDEEDKYSDFVWATIKFALVYNLFQNLTFLG